MPTPPFTFRLGKPERERLVEMARIYGSPNASAFVREMVASICSGNLGIVNGFLGRLGEKLTGQLQLELQQQVIAELKEARGRASEPIQPAQRGLRAPKRGKGAKRGQRPT